MRHSEQDGGGGGDAKRKGERESQAGDHDLNQNQVGSFTHWATQAPPEFFI